MTEISNIYVIISVIRNNIYIKLLQHLNPGYMFLYFNVA